MAREEKTELSHEAVPIYIPVFWTVVAIGGLYLFLVALRVIS